MVIIMTRYVKLINSNYVQDAPYEYEHTLNFDKSDPKILNQNGFYELKETIYPSDGKSYIANYVQMGETIQQFWMEAPFDLENYKLQKKAEINNIRNMKENSGFTYLNKVFDSDDKSVLRIYGANDLAIKCKENNTPFEIEWTCQDNTQITLNADEMMGVPVALAQFSNILHQKASNIKEAIMNASTKEEVDNLVEEMNNFKV